MGADTLVDPGTLYVAGVLFFAALIRSTLGFGEALVAVPLLALRMPVTTAAPLAMLVSVVVAAAIVVHDWRRIEVRSAAGLLAASLAGIPLGVVFLATGDDRVVKLLLGIVIVGFSTYSLTARQRPPLSGDDLRWLLGCGFLAGLLGGAYGMNGPPLAVYGSLRSWSPQQFRATLQGYFLPASLAGVAGYAAAGLLNEAVARGFLWSLPGMAVALAIGSAINRRMESHRFLRLVYVGLLVVGAALLAQSTT